MGIWSPLYMVLVLWVIIPSTSTKVCFQWHPSSSIQLMTSVLLLTPTQIPQALPEALVRVKNTRATEHQALEYFASRLASKPAKSMFRRTHAFSNDFWSHQYTHITSLTTNGTKKTGKCASARRVCIDMCV